jgi:hypothetical protein
LKSYNFINYKNISKKWVASVQDSIREKAHALISTQLVSNTLVVRDQTMISAHKTQSLYSTEITRRSMNGSRLDLSLWNLRKKERKSLLNAGTLLVNKANTSRITSVAPTRLSTSAESTKIKMLLPKSRPSKLSSRKRTQILNSQRRLSQNLRL